MQRIVVGRRGRPFVARGRVIRMSEARPVIYTHPPGQARNARARQAAGGERPSNASWLGVGAIRSLPARARPCGTGGGKIPVMRPVTDRARVGTSNGGATSSVLMAHHRSHRIHRDLSFRDGRCRGTYVDHVMIPSFRIAFRDSRHRGGAYMNHVSIPSFLPR